MIVNSHDLTEWVESRDALLRSAWTPELMRVLEWDEPLAGALAAEFHTAMLTTMKRGGDEKNYLNIVDGIGTGLDLKLERFAADRFFSVTLKLARAASRRKRADQVASAFPYMRASVVSDSRTVESHLPLDGILLPQDHSFWRKWHPPLDMECRAITIAMTKGQFERRGEKVTSEDELAWREDRLHASWPPEFTPLLDFRG